MKELILCAAITHHGLIVSGYRHSNCYDVLRTLSPEIKDSELPSREHQGFLTSKGRYVNRSQAWNIAWKADQVAFGPKGMINGELISENLYDDECISIIG